MSAIRLFLLAPLLASVALTGCQLRQKDSVVATELSNDNSGLVAERDQLRSRNAELETELKAANEKASKNDTPLGKALSKELGKGGAIEGTTVTESGGLALNEDFAFAKGSADLNEDGKKAIEKIATRLNEGENSSAKVLVEGHTDDTPVSRHSTKEKYGDNWGLSAARAASVIRALEVAKVDAKRLTGKFRGEHAPRATDGDKAKNRRVEIYLAD